MVKYTGHLVIIGVLVVLFFSLLILSASDRNVVTSYRLVDNVEVIEFSDLDVIKIGDATVQNNGFLSSRVNLKSYVICYMDGSYSDSYYDVQYRGSGNLQGRTDLFSYNYYQKRIDVSPNEKIELDITISPYFISKYNVEENNLYNTTVSLYLYEMEDGVPVWNYCSSVKAEDAMKVIDLKLNISPDKLSSVKSVPVTVY